MPISDTIYADWTPAGASNFAVCGDKLISWDIVSPFNRFVVWDLDDHTRNAYEISFDAGYEPSSGSTRATLLPTPTGRRSRRG